MNKFKSSAYIFAVTAVALWTVIAPSIIMAADAPPSTVPARSMRITAYASTPDETDSTPFITANGTHVRDGIVASNVLPFGTRIEIPALFGNKVFVVEDRMSKHFHNTVDIWMNTKRSATIFGVHQTDVVLLSEPSPTPAIQISER